jgi:hypothetical protein
MGRKPKTTIEKRLSRVKRECIHYWVIETPQGPTSMGRCKYCGATSEFKNYVPFPSWENKTSRTVSQKEIPDIEAEEDI